MEYIRTMEIDSGLVLFLFKELRDCFLSEVLFVFKHEEFIPLPKFMVNSSDFIWVTNMASEEMQQITSNNFFKTMTLILQVVDDKLNLSDFIRWRKYNA